MREGDDVGEGGEGWGGGRGGVGVRGQQWGVGVLSYGSSKLRKNRISSMFSLDG